MQHLISFGVSTDTPEDYLHTFAKVSNFARMLGAKHSYVSFSSKLLGDSANDESDESNELYYDEFTLFKVREALSKILTSNQEDRPMQDIITDCISEMQNAGILFRELPRDKGDSHVESVDTPFKSS